VYLLARRKIIKRRETAKITKENQSGRRIMAAARHDNYSSIINP